MNIIVNGKEVNLEQPTSVSNYLKSKGVEPQTVVVEHNYSVPDREKWGETILNDGDNLEIVKFMGGG